MGNLIPAATHRRLQRAVRATLRNTVKRDRVLAPMLVGSVQGARTADPVVGLTFDDGPDAATTPRLLSVLADHGILATFFVLADQAEAFPSLLRQLRAAGHEVGLHGDTHRSLLGLPAREAVAMINGGRRRVERVLGEPVELFRPPFGAQSVRSYAVARAVGLQVVMWTAAAKDWFDLEIDDMVGSAMADVRPGGIILLHDAYAPKDPGARPEPRFDRALVLERLLAVIEEKGLEAVTVGQLLAGRRRDRELWFRYQPM